MNIKKTIIILIIFTCAKIIHCENRINSGLNDPNSLTAAEVHNNSIESFISGLCIGYGYGKISAHYFLLYRQQLDSVPRLMLGYLETYCILYSVDKVSILCNRYKLIHDKEALQIGALVGTLITFIEKLHC